MFKVLYGEQEYINSIFLTDLNSTDNTKDILLRLTNDYENINYIDAHDLIKLLENKIGL